MSIAVDIWGVDGGFAMDLNILTMDLRRIIRRYRHDWAALLPTRTSFKLLVCCRSVDTDAQVTDGCASLHVDCA